MKLISADIKNFRLLKNLHLDFSVDPEKPLTVIRAENETGKTTTETALIWGFYGSKLLPGKGAKYQICPSDSLSKGIKSVEISVEIEFETEQIYSIGRGQQKVRDVSYRLRRTCIEYPSESETVRRENEQIVLYEITDDGVKKIGQSNIIDIIENSIPVALKDVYFTDGDSAMSFIEAAAAQGVKRKRVKDAVEALLGLDVLEKLIRHIKQAAKKFATQVDDTDYSKRLVQLNDQIEGWEEDLEEWEAEETELDNEIKLGGQTINKTDKQIEGALRLGNKDELANEIELCKRNIKRNTDASERDLKSISSLFRNSELASSLITKQAARGLGMLNKLNKKKQLPKVNIPILEELLDRDNCFCGSDLRESTEHGQERRELIKNAIENSRSADQLQEAASELFYAVRSEPFDFSPRTKWLEQYSDNSRNYSERQSDIKGYQDELKLKNEEIDRIDDSQISELRVFLDNLKNKVTKKLVEQGSLLRQMEDAKERKKDAEFERNKVENKVSKTDTSSDKLKVARLCQSVFNDVFDRLRKDELKKVSSEMNRIFLNMIGADPEANDLTLITKAELSEDFDIFVYGPGGHALNPDQDLNGASRRAITLAFILALTKVSKVKAPNVIDTPLGMMSGYVRQSVLRNTLKESTQAILFLTPGEIKGVEEILDEKAGKIYTLTNPAHYPLMLVNKANVDDARILRCSCNHRQSCEICERKNEKL